MRLTLVIHSLNGGGAEKTLAQMANHWSAVGHAVTLITLDSRDTSRYEVADNVNWVELNLMHESRSLPQAVQRNRQRVRSLRRTIVETKGDVVVSFTDRMNVLTLLACRGIDTPVIACERSDPRLHHLGRIWSWLRRRTYRTSNAIVVQTAPIRDFVQGFSGDVPIYVVPNCLWPESLPEQTPPLQQRSKQIIGVGRLAKEKGFRFLIDAFARVASNFSDWQLVILGDGPDGVRLQEQIDHLNLDERIELRGWSDNPAIALRDSQLFVLSSEYEGFPNALLEAMACGVAPISVDCESGPSEIIRHEVDGLLVPPNDIDALAAALSRLLADPSEREQLAERAVDVRERFSVERFLADWDDILDAVRGE